MAIRTNNRKRKNINGRRLVRQDEAQERLLMRDERTDQEQIDLLTKTGHGDCREVKRLARRIEKAHQAKVTEQQKV